MSLVWIVLAITIFAVVPFVWIAACVVASSADACEEAYLERKQRRALNSLDEHTTPAMVFDPSKELA